MKQETQEALETLFKGLESHLEGLTDHSDRSSLYIKTAEEFINILDNDPEEKVEMMDAYFVLKGIVSAYYEYEAYKQSESGKAVIDL